jgi:hypothetical protein
MSNDDNRYTDDSVDTELRAAYRQLATETPPPELDAAVLAESRRPVEGERTGFARWRRPLAWVTMIALSFAIVLEFNQTPGVPEAEYARPLQQDAPAESAVGLTPDAATLPDPNVATSSDLVADDSDETLEKLSEAHAEYEKRARDEELSTMGAPQGSNLPAPAETYGLMPEDASPEMRSAPQEAMEAQPSGAAPGTSSFAAGANGIDYLARPADSGYESCSAEVRDEPARWRDCIRELIRAGREREAKLELLLYHEAFPNEPAPDLTQ